METLPEWTFLVNGLTIIPDLIMVAFIFNASKQLNKSQGKIAFLSFVLFFFGWQILASFLAKKDFLLQNILPGFNLILPSVIVGVTISYLLLTKWHVFKNLIERIPISWLVFIQFFRIIGAVFLVLYSQHLLPKQFAIPAGTGDVFIGITALLVGWSLYKNKYWSIKATKWWSYLGILDLITALVMGALTSPSPLHEIISLPFEPTNTIIGIYPLVMIPIFRVPFAITLHLLVLKKLKNNTL